LALRAARAVDAGRVRDERRVEGEALGRALHDERLVAIKAALKPTTLAAVDQEN
jgi:hypothetical protein